MAPLFPRRSPRRLRQAMVAASLAGVAAVAAAPPPAAAQGTTGVITGTVSDRATGAPVIGATVRARGLGGVGSAGPATTSDVGRYRLSNVAPGQYVIEAVAVGYQARRQDTVTVTAGETTIANASLNETTVQLNQVVVTAGRAPEKILDAPASISVVSTQQIERRPVVTAIDHLRTTPGIDVSQGGLAQSNVVARGFNNIFSGSLLTLQDYRFAGVPSLRVNVPFLWTGTNEDVERIEVLLGPASALYGPNSANGVLHVITKSPFTSQGTTITVDGGTQSLFRGALRHASVLTEQVAFKVSGEYFTGKDFQFIDPAEPTAFPATAPAARRGQPNPRDFDVQRYTGEARLDIRPGENSEAITTLGYTSIGSGIELTGANGASQVKNWTYTNIQQRFRYKSLFLQAFANLSDAGNKDSLDTRGTFIRRTGAPIVDQSRVFALQAQHAITLGANDRQRFVYGADYIFTNPRTGNTINGQNEDVDDVSEVGAYVQSTTRLTDRLDFLGAIRVDRHDQIDGTQFSPRAALVFKPSESHSFRATFNRAFSTPANFSFFLDLGQAVNIQGSGFNIRARGNPPKEGWQFQRTCSAAVSGGLCMRSRLAGNGQFVDASAAAAFPTLVAAQAAALRASLTQSFQAAGLPAQQAAAQAAAVVGFVGTLRPTAAQVGTRLAFLGSAQALQPSQIVDIAPLEASYNTTYELGYKGLIGQRARLAVDLWQQKRGDVGTPAGLSTPNVFLDAATLQTYLTQQITGALMAQGAPQPVAAAQAAQIAAGLAHPTQGLPRAPLGVVTFANGNTNAVDVIATYQTINKSITVRGVDLAFDYLVTPQLTLAATYGYQTDAGPTDSTSTVFEEVCGTDGRCLMLNAPDHRASLAVRVEPLDRDGFGGEVRARYNNAFPVNSGVFVSGTNLPFPGVPGQFYQYNSVRTNFLVDAGVSYAFELNGRRALFSLNATNLLNKGKAWTFSGTPTIERMIISRLQYHF
jgi:outer membrane receptor for ferrienterochelin and colicins